MAACCQPCPSVLEGLNAWKNAGMPMALVTNKAAAFTEPLLAATSLRIFSILFYRVTACQKKATPFTLLRTCQQYIGQNNFTLAAPGTW